MTVEALRPKRGTYLIKGGAVITVDPALGTLPKADVLVRDGAIVAVGPDLSAEGAEVIDAFGRQSARHGAKRNARVSHRNGTYAAAAACGLHPRQPNAAQLR